MDNDYREIIVSKISNFMEVLNYENNLYINHVAKFIKTISEKEEDAELLGLATILEKKSRKLLDEEFEWQDQLMEEEKKNHDYRESIRKLCINLFYKNKEFSIDMSKYQEMVDGNRELLEKHGVYKNLLKYVSEKTAIDKVYGKIKDNLSYSNYSNENRKIPDEESIRKLFPNEVKEIYRLADKHVKSKIEETKRLEEDD